MKITSVETIPVRLPFTHGGPPTGFGGKVWTSLDHLLVAIHTESGATGWGEAFGSNVIRVAKAMIDDCITPLLIGRDVHQHIEIVEELERLLHMYGTRQGIASYALSGIDLALWDLAGKAAGVPLSALAGRPPRRDSVDAYASLLRYGDREVVARISAQAVDEGYRRIKLHETSPAAALAGREAVGSDDILLMLDVNCAWSLEQSLQAAPALRELGLHWLEEPIWPHDAFDRLAYFRERTDLTLAAGENVSSASEIQRMLDAHAVDVVQPSIAKIGGPSEFQRVLALADFYPVRVGPHSPYFGPGFLATLQFIASDAADSAIEILYVNFEHDLYAGAVACRNGSVKVPIGPGLGLDPDPDAIARLRCDTK